MRVGVGVKDKVRVGVGTGVGFNDGSALGLVEGGLPLSRHLGKSRFNDG